MDIDTLVNFDWSKDITNAIPRNEFDRMLSNGPNFVTGSASKDLELFEINEESYLYSKVEKELNINLDDICNQANLNESAVEQIKAEVEQYALTENSQVTLFNIKSDIGIIPVQIPLISPLHVSLQVKSIDGCHYLARDKPYLFNICYDISSSSKPFFLNVKLISTESGRSENLAFCTKHNTDSWFSCNELDIKMGNLVQIPLLTNRCERSLCLKFHCNNSCSSMYSKLSLQFEIIDDLEQVCDLKTFNIRISERPGRDEREVCGKPGSSPKILRPNHLSYSLFAGLHNDSNLIRKEVPKLVNFTVPDCRFEVQLSKDNKFYEGNKFTEKIEQQIIFEVSDAFVPQCQGKLYIRSMIIDPKSPENPIICRKGHEHQHILQSVDAIKYEGNSDGIYPDERLSLLIPLQNRFSLQFKCKNVCFVKSDRKFAGLVIILEDEFENMYARRFCKFGIVARPSRSNLNYDVDDSDSDTSESKKKREATSSFNTDEFKKFKSSVCKEY